jgi:hypothetical protein
VAPILVALALAALALAAPELAALPELAAPVLAAPELAKIRRKRSEPAGETGNSVFSYNNLAVDRLY